MSIKMTFSPLHYKASISFAITVDSWSDWLGMTAKCRVVLDIFSCDVVLVFFFSISV